MTAIVFPQEVVVDYVQRLLYVAGASERDTSTLTRQAAALMRGDTHGRVMGVLRKYANRHEQFGADEVRQIVADMETFVDPKIVEQNRRLKEGKEERAKAWLEEKEAEEQASWEPGGQRFNKALGQMKADAHTLIFAAKIIEDSDDPRLVGILREYCDNEERSRLFSRVQKVLESLAPPKPSAPPAKRCSRRRPNGRDDKIVRLFNDT